MIVDSVNLQLAAAAEELPVVTVPQQSEGVHSIVFRCAKTNGPASFWHVELYCTGDSAFPAATAYVLEFEDVAQLHRLSVLEERRGMSFSGALKRQLKLRWPHLTRIDDPEGRADPNRHPRNWRVIYADCETGESTRIQTLVNGPEAIDLFRKYNKRARKEQAVTVFWPAWAPQLNLTIGD